MALPLADGSFIHPVTAPALILVGALMMGSVCRIDWRDMSAAIPAFITMALLPSGFMDEEVCRKLNEEEAGLVRSCVDLRARKIALELKNGSLKLSQLKKNPGSDIHDADLKRQFYLKMKEWYYSSELRPLTPEEDELLARAGPLVVSYPCS